MSKDKIIENMIRACCKALLDKNYLTVCLRIKEDLALSTEGMNRGKPEIWAASIVWAAGSVNFLDDRSFPPYATLPDICTFFKTVKSTVGNKASQIRNALEMDPFNSDYIVEGSPLLSMLDGISVTDDGFVMLGNTTPTKDEATIQLEPLEDDGTINEHRIQAHSNRTLKRDLLLQYEYLLQQMVSRWIKTDGRPRTVKINAEDVHKLIIKATCTKTEIIELAAWMKKQRFTEIETG